MKLRKRIIVSIIAVLILFSGIFVYQRYYEKFFTSSESVAESSVSAILPISTNFGHDNEINSSEMATLDESLQNAEYSGAYMISHNKTIINSNQFGYANAHDSLNFGFNTTSRVGNYQSIINAVLLLKILKQQHKSVTANLDSLVPELQSTKKLTASMILQGKADFGVDSGRLAGLDSKQMFSEYFRLAKKHSSNSLKMRRDSTNILIVILIQRLSHKSYAKNVNDYLRENELSGSRLIESGSKKNRQDGLTYSERSSKGKVSDYQYPNKNIDQNYIVGIDQLRMSMIDILNSVYLINKDHSFDKNYLTKYCNQMNYDGQTFTKQGGLSISSHGNNMSVVTAHGGNNIVVVVDNYANQGIAKLQLADSLAGITFKK